MPRSRLTNHDLPVGVYKDRKGYYSILRLKRGRQWRSFRSRYYQLSGALVLVRKTVDYTLGKQELDDEEIKMLLIYLGQLSRINDEETYAHFFRRMADEFLVELAESKLPTPDRD